VPSTDYERFAGVCAMAAGVLGFKAFLCPSGIDEFPAAREADLRAALPALRGHASS
jgi:hypothetical protein